MKGINVLMIARDARNDYDTILVADNNEMMGNFNRSDFPPYLNSIVNMHAICVLVLCGKRKFAQI